ncbi:L,D-transpeptidase family protein [Streptomyces sp. NPDC051909]|uniref:L,D-transpeptidase n=1 Tax=Streptomyces sp. NPDC051909 TaxID=3154944 RepID=UPI003418FBEB
MLIVRATGAATAATAFAALLCAAPAAEAAVSATAVSATATVSAASCTAPTGPYQRPLEQYLGRPVDGVQSEADCAAIRAFQQREKTPRTDGYADLATYRTMVAAQARPNPNAQGRCPVRAHRVTCVDLDRQLLWVQTGRKVGLGPVPIRTGRDTMETRPGWHTIYWRDRNHVSSLYDAPMPYSQFFDAGQALHGHPGNLFDGGGSAGCVNLSMKDAEALWKLLKVEDRVYVWGTKPGTAD